jgi:hypothetical protein
MKYIPSLINIGSNLGGGMHIQAHTHGQQGDFIILLIFFKLKKADKNYHDGE